MEIETLAKGYKKAGKIVIAKHIYIDILSKLNYYVSIAQRLI
jgi:hypothetical protein